MKCGMKRYRDDLSHLKDKPTDSALETKFQEMMQQRSLSAIPVSVPVKESMTESITESVTESMTESITDSVESVPAHMTPWKTPSAK